MNLSIMTPIILVFLCLGLSHPAPITASDSSSRLLRYEDQRDLDRYKYGFETDNGISREEVGEIKIKENEEVLSVSGTYAFTAEDGKRYIVTYTADENGYRPSIQMGELPPLVGIPSAALASLAGGGLG